MLVDHECHILGGKKIPFGLLASHSSSSNTKAFFTKNEAEALCYNYFSFVVMFLLHIYTLDISLL